jgi:hypothetical protein
MAEALDYVGLQLKLSMSAVDVYSADINGYASGCAVTTLSAVCMWYRRDIPACCRVDDISIRNLEKHVHCL